MNYLLPLGQEDPVYPQDHFHQVDPEKQKEMNRAIYQNDLTETQQTSSIDALEVIIKWRTYLWSRMSTRSWQPRWATSTLWCQTISFMSRRNGRKGFVIKSMSYLNVLHQTIKLNESWLSWSPTILPCPPEIQALQALLLNRHRPANTSNLFNNMQ